MANITAEDKKWQAQDDARTLIYAEAIQADKSRRSAAIKEVKNIAKEKKKEMVAAERVAKKKPIKKPVKKSTKKKKRSK